ncbi:hypothetical protein GM658_20170 [Pseudoduganella eburnea]|uniref:Uncharacterized protein n=1 Tax=Massilia eburnea TaxID=1776165 RepID=A0A6L6QLX6_9BURK|nr:hypothetical protein [Massilia eburnea]MTW12927.1 hypothetical protein [Massilia eburnea]
MNEIGNPILAIKCRNVAGWVAPMSGLDCDNVSFLEWLGNWIGYRDRTKAITDQDIAITLCLGRIGMASP